MIEKKQQINVEQNTVLVGLVQPNQTEVQVNEYLEELTFLAETAGVNTIKRFTQKLKHPDARTFVGKGKLEQIKNFIISKGNIDLVIFDEASQMPTVGGAVACYRNRACTRPCPRA